MIEPPVRMPDHPCGAKGCQFPGCTYCAPAMMKAKIAAIFKITMVLLASADSRIPRTSTTVRIITIRNAGKLKPKCNPGAYSILPCKSVRPDGRYAGEIQRNAGCQPNQSNSPTRCAAKPTLT